VARAKYNEIKPAGPRKKNSVKYLQYLIFASFLSMSLEDLVFLLLNSERTLPRPLFAGCETVQRKWRRLHNERGHVPPLLQMTVQLQIFQQIFLYASFWSVGVLLGVKLSNESGADCTTNEGTCPHFYKWLGTGVPRVEEKNKKATKLYCTSRKHSPTRLEPKIWTIFYIRIRLGLILI